MAQEGTRVIMVREVSTPVFLVMLQAVVKAIMMRDMMLPATTEPSRNSGKETGRVTVTGQKRAGKKMKSKPQWQLMYMPERCLISFWMTRLQLQRTEMQAKPRLQANLMPISSNQYQNQLRVWHSCQSQHAIHSPLTVRITPTSPVVSPLSCWWLTVVPQMRQSRRKALREPVMLRMLMTGMLTMQWRALQANCCTSMMALRRVRYLRSGWVGQSVEMRRQRQRVQWEATMATPRMRLSSMGWQSRTCPHTNTSGYSMAQTTIMLQARLSPPIFCRSHSRQPGRGCCWGQGWVLAAKQELTLLTLPSFSDIFIVQICDIDHNKKNHIPGLALQLTIINQTDLLSKLFMLSWHPICNHRVQSCF